VTSLLDHHDEHKYLSFASTLNRFESNSKPYIPVPCCTRNFQKGSAVFYSPPPKKREVYCRCHMTGQQDKPVCLAVWALLWSDEHGGETWELNQRGTMILDKLFCGQKVYQVNKFISACMLSMEAMTPLVQLCMGAVKCFKMAVRVWRCSNIVPQPLSLKILFPSTFPNRNYLCIYIEQWL
jgi:hypothetical protein